MDMFMDKLAQKLTAQEMIQANMAADAQEMEKLKDKVKEYNQCLEQVQKLAKEGVLRLEAAKTQGNAEVLEALGSLQESSAESKRILSSLQEILGQDRENLSRLQELLEQNGEALGTLEEKLAASDENVHKEGVKIYRNIQAVILEENKKQTQELKAAFDALLEDSLKEYMEKHEKEAAAARKKASGRLNTILVCSILTLLAALGSLGMWLYSVWGIELL